ncbi:MAG: hypothetical protein ACYSUG_03485 [Planctomycetota bacterium]|jgi:uncharacterized protein YerC
MKNGNKQLDELLRQFMDEDHIHELKEDLSFADQLFAAHPVPDVHQETIASIQVKVRRKLRQQRYRAIGKWVATAAAILLAVLLSREHLVNTENTTEPFPTKIYSSQDLWKDELYVVNSQVDPIERELVELADSIRAVSLETYETTDSFSIDVMEIEEIEYLADNASF